MGAENAPKVEPGMNLCKITGHRPDPDAMYYYGVLHCTRCHAEFGEQEYGLTQRLRVVVRIRWAEFRHWCWRVRWWIRCDYCGGWFGRCDESVDHIPF